MKKAQTWVQPLMTGNGKVVGHEGRRGGGKTVPTQKEGGEGVPRRVLGGKRSSGEVQLKTGKPDQDLQ